MNETNFLVFNKSHVKLQTSVTNETTYYSKLKAMFGCSHPPPATFHLRDEILIQSHWLAREKSQNWRHFLLPACIHFILGISWVNALLCSCEWKILEGYAAKLRHYRLGKHLKIIRRYSHVLCRITVLKKSGRFESFPLWLYLSGTPPLTFT